MPDRDTTDMTLDDLFGRDALGDRIAAVFLVPIAAALGLLVAAPLAGWAWQALRWTAGL